MVYRTDCLMGRPHQCPSSDTAVLHQPYSGPKRSFSPRLPNAKWQVPDPNSRLFTPIRAAGNAGEHP